MVQKSLVEGTSFSTTFFSLGFLSQNHSPHQPPSPTTRRLLTSLLCLSRTWRRRRERENEPRSPGCGSQLLRAFGLVSKSGALASGFSGGFGVSRWILLKSFYGVRLFGMVLAWWSELDGALSFVYGASKGPQTFMEKEPTEAHLETTSHTKKYQEIEKNQRNPTYQQHPRGISWRLLFVHI